MAQNNNHTKHKRVYKTAAKKVAEETEPKVMETGNASDTTTQTAARVTKLKLPIPTRKENDSTSAKF